MVFAKKQIVSAEGKGFTVSLDLIASFPHFYPYHSISASYKAGKLLGPILVAAVQTAAEQILQSFVVPGSSLMSTVI